MAEDQIRYDVLVQDALRGVVRKVLTEVAKAGLPGEHHFYIAFDTTAPGVRISSRLREKYPTEMTVVLQHQFWEMTVTDHAIEVGLSFAGVAEKLFIPYTAIKGFFDPSVQFGLQFEPEKSAEQPVTAMTGAVATEGDDVPFFSEAVAAAEQDLDGPLPEPVPAQAADEEAVEPTVPSEPEGEDEGDDAAGADVVSLDAFRKKS